MDLRVGLCTVPDRESARHIARALVAERLAACVNIVSDVTSVYRWQGEVAENAELLLIIKTSTSVNLARLKDRLLTLHPYDVPEFLLLPVTSGLEKYLSWVDESLQTEAESDEPQGSGRVAE